MTAVSKVHDVTYLPSTGTPVTSVKQSVSKELTNTDTYSVTETVQTWERTISVAPSVLTVKGTALHRSSVVGIGKSCSVTQMPSNALRMKVTVTLAAPEDVPE